jgi:hypothetical protein
MSIKCVVIFQQVTEPGHSFPSVGLVGRSHIGGWSESYWWPTDDLSQATAALKGGGSFGPGLLPKRANLLASACSILGVRFYAGGAGKGIFKSMNYPGQYALSDIPQMALLAYMSLQGTSAVRRLVLRGVPDSMVDSGEFAPLSGYVQELLNFAVALSYFGGLGADTVTAYPVFGVSAAGLVTLNAVANPFAVASTVTFRNVLNEAGKRSGGSYVVSTIGPLSNQFTVAGWEKGLTTGGDVRIPTVSVHAMVGGSFTVSRILTRKVGRPFEQYRGRQSSRR